MWALGEGGAGGGLFRRAVRLLYNTGQDPAEVGNLPQGTQQEMHRERVRNT